MSIYCHGCASLFYANQKLEQLVRECLAVKDGSARLIAKAGFMRLPGRADDRVRQLLSELREVGVSLDFKE